MNTAGLSNGYVNGYGASSNSSSNLPPNNYGFTNVGFQPMESVRPSNSHVNGNGPSSNSGSNLPSNNYGFGGGISQPMDPAEPLNGYVNGNGPSSNSGSNLPSNNYGVDDVDPQPMNSVGPSNGDVNRNGPSSPTPVTTAATNAAEADALVVTTTATSPPQTSAFVVTTTEPTSEWDWEYYINWPKDDPNSDLQRKDSPASSSEQNIAANQAAVTIAQPEATTTASNPFTTQGMLDISLHASDDVIMEDAPDEGTENAPDLVNPADTIYRGFRELATPYPPIENNGNAEELLRDINLEDYPVLQAIVDQPLYIGTWEQHFDTTFPPLDANGNRLQIDHASILETVDRAMEGFETDELYQQELSHATEPLVRAELARMRFRKCWHTVAIAQVANDVVMNAFDPTRYSEADRARVVFFVAGRDTILQADAHGQNLRQMARWGWHLGRWGWIDVREGIPPGPFNTEIVRLVDMQELAELYGVNQIYEQRFPAA